MARERRYKKREPKIREKPEFEQKLVEIARVTRVTGGGKRLRFRACMVIGDRKGRVGTAVAKGPDVAVAVQKAIARAKKRLIKVTIVNDTVPHEVRQKFKAARILIKPASQGKGIIAGGAMRPVLELAGIQNVTAKILGSKNKINNVRATINALKKLKLPVSSRLKIKG